MKYATQCSWNVIQGLFVSKLSRDTCIELEGPGLHTGTIESNSLGDMCVNIHFNKNFRWYLCIPKCEMQSYRES